MSSKQFPFPPLYICQCTHMCVCVCVCVYSVFYHQRPDTHHAAQKVRRSRAVSNPVQEIARSLRYFKSEFSQGCPNDSPLSLETVDFCHLLAVGVAGHWWRRFMIYEGVGSQF